MVDSSRTSMRSEELFLDSMVPCIVRLIPTSLTNVGVLLYKVDCQDPSLL